MHPDAIAKHNATIALLWRVEATRYPERSDSRRHCEGQAVRYELACNRDIQPAGVTDDD